MRGGITEDAPGALNARRYAHCRASVFGAFGPFAFCMSGARLEAYSAKWLKCVAIRVI